MRRLILCALFVFAPSMAFTQDTILVRLSSLGLGPVLGLLPVELDGRPGSEYFLKVNDPFTSLWTVIYPAAPNGLCTAGQVSFRESVDHLVDRDGDGRDEIMRFDEGAQTVSFSIVPRCPAP